MELDIPKIIASVDHTLLAPTATWPQVKEICDDALEYGTASVCIPPCHVGDAADYLKGRVPVCTVIGFPLGFQTPTAKLFEAKAAVMDGAAEIDMVINLAHVKEGRFDKIFSEINSIKTMIEERHILKVIVETCLLTREEKLRLCELVSRADADYIKTSTGFSTGGATPEDVELFARHAEKDLKIKASGGIRTLEDAQMFLDLGAHRLGTSKVIPLLRERGIKGKNAPDRFTPQTV